MTSTQASPARVVDWEWAPRVVIVLVVVTLAARGLPSAETVVRPTIDIVAASTFCAWLWIRCRLSASTSLAFGIALTAVGIFQGFGATEGVALFVGASVIIVIQPLRRIPVALLALVTVMFLVWVAGGMETWVAVGATADWLLIVFVVSMLERTYAASRELRTTQRLLADEQVDQERLRVNDELAQMLGCTFTGASEQLEQARELAATGTEQVQHQLSELTDLVSKGRRQLERISFEPQIQGLDDELANAASLCHHLGVDMTTSADEISDPRVSEFAAVVVCESVTNMFKHANPTRCVVVVREDDDEVILSITNDGVTDSSRGPGSRTGQHRWRPRLVSLGGRLESGPLSAGRYRVLIRIPRTTTA